jgi:hypothetical protein
MISYTSNVSQVVRLFIKKVEGVQGDLVARAAALAVLPEMKRRVHVDGKASDGSRIGNYSNAYLKLRTGNYGNSAKVTRGKNKGEKKDAGVFTKGKNKGQPRPKFNRTTDPKVVLSLTRQQENDMSVVPAGKGYGIGYKNQHNFDKSQYAEATYKKQIWKLTKEERQLAREVAEAEVKRQLNL